MMGVLSTLLRDGGAAVVPAGSSDGCNKNRERTITKQNSFCCIGTCTYFPRL